MTSQPRIWCQRRPAFESDLAGHLLIGLQPSRRSATAQGNLSTKEVDSKAIIGSARPCRCFEGSQTCRLKKMQGMGWRLVWRLSKLGGLSRELRFGKTCKAF